MTTAAEDDRPLLTYCRLGKDRTGLMTALVLSTCGATQSEIISDYIRYGLVACSSALCTTMSTSTSPPTHSHSSASPIMLLATSGLLKRHRSVQ